MRYILALLLTFTSIASADTGTENLFGAWGTAVFQGKLSDTNFLWYLEGSARATDNVRTKTSHSGNGFDLHVLMGRAAFGYQLNDTNKVYLGYAYQESDAPYSKVALSEHRVYQQYDHKHVFDNKDSLTFRTRLEERNVDVSSETSVRFREQLKYTHPLMPKLSLVASEEIFVNTNSVNWGPQSGFDQNRGFVGIGYKFNDKFRTEVGYMNQYMNRVNNYDRMAHLFNVTLYGDFI